MGGAKNPMPIPCYAVIFTSRLKSGGDENGYADMAAEMAASCAEQPGFLRLESARGADGTGITVCYWESEAHIQRWRENPRHGEAQKRGKAEWYADYTVTIARVERTYGPRS